MYEGYVNLHIYPTSHGTFGFINKVIDNMDADIYYVEFPIRDTSILLQLKYSRHKRRNRRAGGDSGVIKIPQLFLKTLLAWGITDGYVYVRIWTGRHGEGHIERRNA
jgi:hypothetical protein